MRDADRLSRRALIGAGVAALAYRATGAEAGEVKTRENKDAWRGLKFGVASYSFR